MDVSTLLCELSHTPRIAGVCRGRADVFDNPRAIAVAMDICAVCPVQQHCADYYLSLPEGLHPNGVVAGELLRHKSRPGDGAAPWIDDELPAHRQPPDRV